jgi:hypothetical protein
MEVLSTYSSTDFRQLRGEELRQANDEYFAAGTGPRAAFEAARLVDVEFERMTRTTLADLAFA